MTCREFSDFISAYLAGELDPGVRQVFERHLSRCPNCSEYLAQFRRTVGVARTSFEVEGDPVEKYGIPDDLVAAILVATSE